MSESYTSSSHESFLDRHSAKIVAGLLATGITATGLLINSTAPDESERLLTDTMIMHETAFEQMKIENPALTSFTFSDGSVCLESLKKDGLRRHIVCSLPQDNE